MCHIRANALAWLPGGGPTVKDLAAEARVSVFETASARETRRERARALLLSEAVASFKAPQRIAAVGSYGTSVCVGCSNGALCFLQASFLAG